MGNNIRTVVLLAVLTAFIVWLGQMIGGAHGMVIALVLAAAMNFFSYWFSDKIVLRMYRAQEVTSKEQPLVYEIVQKLTVRAGLPMPKVFLIPDESPNAFATGRNPEHAVVAVTLGLVHLMSKEELEGVIAHELAHIKNRDILISSIAATLAGAIMVIANMSRFAAIFGGHRSDDNNSGSNIIGLIIMSIIAPLAAMIIQMAISRTREYLADSTGANFAGNPKGLSSALSKLGSYTKNLPMAANPSTAHMFIVNPLSGKSLIYLFSTHPPLEERIRRLGGTRERDNSGGGLRPNSGEEAAKSFWENLS